jgi:nucleotide-binding universal stress UspA family protein
MAAELARRAGARITLACATGHDGLPPEVAEHAAFLREQLGAEPDIEAAGGRAAHTIDSLAIRCGADLLIIGSRGLHGPRALASTSERVAHEAPMSVLIMRPAPAVPVRPELAAAAHAAAIRARDEVVARRVASGRLA